jgi:putative IMPACT (imprinted ancient) family translation regulator
VGDVRAMMAELLSNRKIARATHNILAYRIQGSEGLPEITQGCDNDGEAVAGSRMLHLLQNLQVTDVAVVVTRWYGGIQLGADRFKHINNATR